MVRRTSEMEFSCRTRWLNYELENARYLRGWENLLGYKEVSPAMAHIASVLAYYPYCWQVNAITRCGEGNEAALCVMKA